MDRALQLLAEAEARGDKLVAAHAARDAGTGKMNVSRALSRMRESGAWAQLVSQCKEDPPLLSPPTLPQPAEPAAAPRTPRRRRWASRWRR